MCKRLGADRGVQQPEPEHFRHQACVGTVVGTTGTEPVARARTRRAKHTGIQQSTAPTHAPGKKGKNITKILPPRSFRPVGL